MKILNRRLVATFWLLAYPNLDVCVQMRVAQLRHLQMRKILSNFLEGLGQVLIIAPGRKYTRPMQNEFKRDADRLRRDSNLVIRGFNKKIKQGINDQSANHC